MSRTETHSSVTSWRNAVFVIFGLTGLCFSTWVARVPAVRDVLHYSTGEMAILLFGLAAGSIVGLVLAPNILSWLGARRGLLLTLGSFTVALALAGVAVEPLRSPPVIFIVLAMFGFAYSSTDVLMNVDGAEVEKRVGKTILPLMHAFFSIGTLAGALLGTAAAALSIPVLAHFLIVAMIVAATAAIALRYVPAQPIDSGPADERPFGERFREGLAIWADLRLVLIGVMVIGMTFAEGSANDWLPLAAVDGHGLDNAGGAFTYGIFVVAMTLGRGFGGPLVDRFGRARVLAALAVLGIVGLGCFIFSDTPSLTYIGVFMWGLGGSLGFPVGMSAAADHPTQAARRVSIVSIFGYAAFLIGPPVIGVLADHFGILEALLIVVAMLIVSLAATPAVKTPPRRAPHHDTEPAA